MMILSLITIMYHKFNEFYEIFIHIYLIINNKFIFDSLIIFMKIYIKFIFDNLIILMKIFIYFVKFHKFNENSRNSPKFAKITTDI